MDRENGGEYASRPAASPLKLLALEALADPDFYDKLRDDPEGAAQTLGIQLSDADLEFLTNDIHWAVLDAHIDEMREALHMQPTQASW
jgi:hypothetical protein